MLTYITEWTGLLLRWAHVIAAIAWIGHAFLFHTLEEGLSEPEVDDVDKDVFGELWMVHGGGFFRLQKTRVLPGKYTGDLVWFFHEAGATWLSGFLLLIVVFYSGGGQYLMHPAGHLGPWASMGVGLGTLVLGWVIYDQIWVRLGEMKAVAYGLTAALIFGSSIALTQLLSGRAAFIHVGALMGTIMAANVFMRIIPGSRKMVAALEKGEEPDLRYGHIGHQRSVHNGYFHLPVIFIMISNHFSSTYGHELNWLILILFIVMGSATRQLFYDGSAAHAGVKATVAASFAALIVLTAPIGGGQAAVEPPPVAGETQPIPRYTGIVAGSIDFEGTPPERTELQLRGCESAVDGKVFDDQVLVSDGKLQNTVVWLKEGWDRWEIPEAPATPVRVDQHRCVYTERAHAARVGQAVHFVNSDPLYHNVRTVSDANETFNLNMPKLDQVEERVFLRPELAVEARCDVHPWMKSHIAVLPHDWWSISGPDGRFRIEGVPPGEYTLEAWHEVYGAKTARVVVEAGAVSGVSFGFGP